MKNLMRSMLLHACSCGKKQATWQIVQHVMMTGSKEDLEDIIDFVHEYPEKWPSDFRSRIFAMEMHEATEHEVLERMKAQEQLMLQRQQDDALLLHRLDQDNIDNKAKIDDEASITPLDHLAFHADEPLYPEPSPA